MNYKPFTGIGSRKTPIWVLEWIENSAVPRLSEAGFTLRSGGADGADEAFETDYTGDKEIYLPWNGFNENPSPIWHISPIAYQIAQEIHPNWASLSQAGQKLHARNVHQVMGKRLNSPSLFVLCWCQIKNGEPQGGTRTAIKLAEKYGIPVYNLAKISFNFELDETLTHIIDTHCV